MQDKHDAEILLLLSKDSTYEKGFRMLMAAYQERIYWHVRRMVNDHSDADDVVQNTFIKVFKGFRGFRGNSRLYTWLYRIATNETLSFLDKKRRQPGLQGNSDIEDLSDKLEADVYFDGDAASKKLTAAVATLPDKQKAVFSMRYYDEMSYKEISSIMGTSVGALKASFHHAARKVEQYLLEIEAK